MPTASSSSTSVLPEAPASLAGRVAAAQSPWERGAAVEMGDVGLEAGDEEAKDAVEASPWDGPGGGGGGGARRRRHRRQRKRRGTQAPARSATASARLKQLAVARNLNVAGGFAAVRFHWRRFGANLAYHMLFPLLLPLEVALEGATFARNQGWYGSWDGVRLQHVPVAALVLMTSVYALRRPPHVHVTEVLLPWALFFIHKCMVSVKYAYMYDADYAALHAQPDAGGEVSLRQQLVTGWRAPNAGVVLYEVDAAAARLGITLDGVSFRVAAAEADGAAAFLAGAGGRGLPPGPDMPGGRLLPAPEDPAGSSLLPVRRLVARWIMLSSDHSARPYTGWFSLAPAAMALGVVAAALPSLVRTANGHRAWAGSDAYAAAVIVPAFCVTAFFYGVLVEFLGVASSEYRRRACVLALLGALVNPAHRDEACDARAERDPQRMAFKRRVLTTPGLPYADLTDASNVLAFLVARQVSHSYGLAYRKRVDLYVAATLLLVLALAVLLLVEVLTGTLSVAAVAVAVYVVASCSAYVALTARHGMDADSSSANHRLTLVRSQLAVRELVAGASREYRAGASAGRSKDELRATDRLLASAASIAEIDEAFSSLRLLGLGGSGALQLLFALVLSTATVSYHLLTET